MGTWASVLNKRRGKWRNKVLILFIVLKLKCFKRQLRVCFAFMFRPNQKYFSHKYYSDQLCFSHRLLSCTAYYDCGLSRVQASVSVITKSSKMVPSKFPCLAVQLIELQCVITNRSESIFASDWKRFRVGSFLPQGAWLRKSPGARTSDILLESLALSPLPMSSVVKRSKGIPLACLWRLSLINSHTQKSLLALAKSARAFYSVTDYFVHRCIYIKIHFWPRFVC